MGGVFLVIIVLLVACFGEFLFVRGISSKKSVHEQRDSDEEQMEAVSRKKYDKNETITADQGTDKDMENKNLYEAQCGKAWTECNRVL